MWLGSNMIWVIQLNHALKMPVVSPTQIIQRAHLSGIREMHPFYDPGKAVEASYLLWCERKKKCDCSVISAEFLKRPFYKLQVLASFAVEFEKIQGNNDYGNINT